MNVFESLSALAPTGALLTPSFTALQLAYNPLFGFLLCLVIYQADMSTALVTLSVSVLYNFFTLPYAYVFPAMVACLSIYRAVFALFDLPKTSMVDGMVAMVLNDLPSSELMEVTISLMCFLIRPAVSLYQRLVPRFEPRSPLCPAISAETPADLTSATSNASSKACVEAAPPSFLSVSCDPANFAQNALASSKAIMLVLAIVLSSTLTATPDPTSSRKFVPPSSQSFDYYIPGRALVAGLWVFFEHLKAGETAAYSLQRVLLFEVGYNMNYLLRSKNVRGEANNLITGLILGSIFKGTGLGDMAATTMLAPSSGLVRKAYNAVMATNLPVYQRFKMVAVMFPYILMYASGVLLGRISRVAALSLAAALSSYYLFFQGKTKPARKPANGKSPAPKQTSKGSNNQNPRGKGKQQPKQGNPGGSPTDASAPRTRTPKQSRPKRGALPEALPPTEGVDPNLSTETIVAAAFTSAASTAAGF